MGVGNSWGIDSYSRIPVYLNVAVNNRSETLFSAFLSAVTKLGLPLHVRADHVGENTLVASYMREHPQRVRGSFIAGQSVHNQIIEYLWRHVFSGCVTFFYYQFYSLEDVGLLDPNNVFDLWALHCVFLQKLYHY